MKIRHALSVSLVLLMTTFCHAGRWQDFGRWFGNGYGDGYHGCKGCESGICSVNSCQACQQYNIATTPTANPFRFQQPRSFATPQRPVIVNSVKLPQVRKEIVTKPRPTTNVQQKSIIVNSGTPKAAPPKPRTAKARPQRTKQNSIIVNTNPPSMDRAKRTTRSISIPERQAARERLKKTTAPENSPLAQPTRRRPKLNLSKPPAKYQINDAWKPQSTEFVSTRRLTNVEK